MHSDRYASFRRRAEIVVAVIMFFAMLISCGLYINIKMNGKNAGLPPLSDADKRMLERSAGAESVIYDDDLIEPVFIGVRLHGESVAVFPDDNQRRGAETVLYEAVSKLFSGTTSEMSFNSYEERLAYIEEIKESEGFVLISFYSDLHSELFLPCMANSFSSFDNSLDFEVRNLFILPDGDLNIYGISISSDNEIFVLKPSSGLSFNKISEEAYDVVKDGSLFKFNEKRDVLPVLTSTFRAHKYNITSAVKHDEKGLDSLLVQDLLAIFSMNKNMVKSFSSGDNSEINYVVEGSELVINDNGLVLFNTDESGGIPLSDFPGFYSGGEAGYSFADKIFALKSLVNRLRESTNISFCISGLDYDEASSSLSVYFKYFTDGCIVTENAYDAVFEITDNILTYAEFYMLEAEKIDQTVILYPQNYAAAVFGDEKDTGDFVICPVLTDDGENVKAPCWTRISFSEGEGE